MAKLRVHTFNGTADVSASYVLRLDGTLTGNAGKFEVGSFFTIAKIEIIAADTAVLVAELPAQIEIPAGLIDPDAFGVEGKLTDFKKADKLKADLDAAGAAFRARVEESFRRLQTIEIDWAAGAFLGPAGKVTSNGQARLALALLLETDEAKVKGLAVAELRATLDIEGDVGGSVKLQRTYGIVCRTRIRGEATLSLDLDEFNLSLPDVVLPHLDLTKFAGIKIPTDLTGLRKLVGAFSQFGKDEEFEVTHTWAKDPALAVLLRDDGFHFALMEADLAANDYDLSQYNAASPPKLATLQVKVTKKNTDFELTAKDIKLARYPQVVTAEGTLQASGGIDVPNDTRNFGPLKISWEGVRITGKTDLIAAGTPIPDKRSARASVTFQRVILCPVDDPAAVIAFRGEIEITPSGTRVIELALVEPYPFVLVARTAAALLRGAQKILEILGQIKPASDADIEGLKKLLEVLGKIAAATARAVVFIAREVGEIVAALAELIAKAAIKVAELLLALLKELAKLAGDAKPGQFTIDVELRIALDPLELRQVILTLPGFVTEKIAVDALGFRLEIRKGWRPALLLDFVAEPGAYLCALRDASPDPLLATLSTDLWLKRPEGGAAAVNDASHVTGKRDPQPLLAVDVEPADKVSPILIVLAGLRRAEPIFLHRIVNEVKRELEIPGGPKIKVVDGPFTMRKLDKADVGVELRFQQDRLLPLLGMGETGAEGPAPTTGDSFLDRLKKSLGQIVTVKETTTKADFENRRVEGAVVLEIQAAGVKTEAKVGVTVSLDDFEVAFSAASVFPVISRRIEERALGMTWIVEQADEKKRRENAEVQMFTLAFAGAEGGFELNKKDARMEIRFDGLSSDGEGVVFDVETFRIGRGGLDVTAKVLNRSVRLNGLDVPFRFTSGRIVIQGGKLVEGVVNGRGQLPPKLVGDANCSVVLAFELVDGELALKNGSKVELEKIGDPIVCHGTRFTLTITHLELGFARDGGYHFYFLVTGSLRFTPKTGEFEEGLLQHLKDLEIEIEQAPLTGDPRVLLRHIRFQKELKPKKTFPLFNIFTFELRGFGFHPASPKFDGRPPAMSISGQIRFADLGDVMQPKIDFHELWIAPPKENESLPRIKAEGLGVELQLAGSVKIRGAVLAVDRDTKTVEGHEFAPPEYKASGFLGEGAVDIPGLCAIEASMGFLEIERENQPEERKKAFFLFLQANKLAVEIPTPVWTFYLREAGFGFGYRYTLAGIKDAENAKSAAQLVRVLDDVSKRQGDLARFAAWKPDSEKDNFTLALRGAFQPFFAEKKYNEKREKEAVSPFFFDIVAALRSDFTFLMSARGWLGVNYASFLENEGGFRDRPMFRGYLYISVPRSELLLRAIADSRGFVGKDWPELKEGPLREAVQSVDWTTTLYIRPGLFHYEVGWPDQLAVRLVDKPNMRVIVRGGMIFRAAEEGLLFGYNIGAEAFLRFEGRAGGSIGVALVAELNARFVARVLAFLAANFKDSLVYGLVALDARLTFSVEAWMDVDLGFTSFTLRIGFSFSVQFTAAVELAISGDGVGGRVDAHIAVQAFGCSLGVGIGFSFNARQLDAARARVARFMALSITSEEPDAPPVFAAKSGDKAIEKGAEAAEAVHQAQPPKPKATGDKKPDINRAQFGRTIEPTDFWLVLRQAGAGPGRTSTTPDHVYALLVPKEATDVDQGSFFAAPEQYKDDAAPLRSEELPVHTIVSAEADLHDLQIWIPGKEKQTGKFDKFKPNTPITARWNAPIEVPGGDASTFTLAFFFDECFLANTSWKTTVRKAENWKEPQLRFHARRDVASGSREVRDELRDQFQRDYAADAIRLPYDERAWQARSTVMTMFLDQFVALAAIGDRTGKTVGDVPEAHVTDLGLVLYGKADEIAKLAGAEVQKHDASAATRGKIRILNPRNHWFDQQDPLLDQAHHSVEPDGIKLDWRLLLEKGDDPEQLLHHYEIVRTIEPDFTAYEMKVKPAATIGKRLASGQVELLEPDWQFIDTLTDARCSETMRRALLPPLGEADGLEAAKAWLQLFPEKQDVTVTYSVVPVDIAGARGLPRSFTIDIPRPAVPIRPAIGELRIVQTMPAAAAAKDDDSPPDDLQIYLALNDRAWDDASPTQSIGGVTYTVERSYRLILDPDDVEPAGHYGSDATTSRVRGPGAFTPTKTADEKTVRIPRAATVPFDADPKITEIEPEKAEREKLPRWARLSDKALKGSKAVFPAEAEKNALTTLEQLHEALWRRGGRRVSTRFFLETLLRFVPPDKTKSVEFVSKRVAIPVEHVLETRKGTKEETTATLRPDAFEWPVPLALPPLGEGQVDAESGFARFRVPKAGARLRDLRCDLKDHGVVLERDPERRVLTTVRFAAVPDWVTDAKLTPASLHAPSIAGFELHELDIDELAPRDVTPKTSIGVDAAAWRRAACAARIEQLSPQDARHAPHGNFDWQGWQAHYPSETQRIGKARSAERGKDSKPIRTAWYSDRETTPHLAERRPRLRLLPLPPESAIAELLSGGRPNRISAWLTAAADSNAKKLPVALIERPLKPQSFLVVTPKPDDECQLIEVNLAADFEKDVRLGKEVIPETARTFKKSGGGAFDARDVRHFLLCLAWPPFLESAASDPLLKAWLEDSTAFDGLTLVLEGEGDFKRPKMDGTIETHHPVTKRVEVPLDLRSQSHPILEEVLSQLALDNRETGRPSMYRRFTVMPQPVTPMVAKEIDGFLAGTAPEADPYGWKVLQTLGCAATVRLYDAATEAFVNPEALADRVDRVLHSVLSRWKEAYGDDHYPRVSGQVFVEVFLRPGADRLAGPFDAVIANALEAETAPPIDLDDEGLAFVQISLRPRPEPVWCYTRQQIQWRKPDNFQKAGARLAGLSLLVTRKDADFDVARARGGASFEVTATTRSAALPIPPRVGAAGDDENLELYFRVEHNRSGPGDRPDIALAVEWETVETVDEKPAKVKREREVLALGDPRCPIQLKGDWAPVDEPGSIHPDPFDRFAAVAIDKWTTRYTSDGGPARESFDAWRAAALAAGFGVPDVKRVITPFVPWAQRFLDHGATRDPEGAPRPTEPFLAVCAPTKATPWRLAPDADGYVRLSFLHSDRWSHTRGYAVKTVSRYHELLTGIGLDEEQRAEALVPEKGFTRNIGVAVAVSPRTERVEAPLIMASRLTKTKKKTDVIELVVARHGEESLAASNRPLLAHLGMPTSLLSFSRSYRHPQWPDRLNEVISTEVKPKAITLPARDAVVPVRSTGEQVEGDEVGTLATELPSLWKGADIWRIPPLPPHYRLIALASERSGIVVSEVTAASVDNMPRVPLQGREQDLLDEALALSVTRKDKESALLKLTHRFVSYLQVTPKGDEVFKEASVDDVARWPDPDVIYVLLRRRVEDGKPVAEQEDAEVRLVAVTAKANETAIPIVVQTRGTHYRAGNKPAVRFDDSGNNRTFFVDTPLQLNVRRKSEPLTADERGTAEQIAAFNKAAAEMFAAILTPHELTIDLAPIDMEQPAKFLLRVQEVAGALRKGAEDVLAKLTFPWYEHDLTRQAEGRAAALDAWRVSAVGASVAELRKTAPLPIRLATPWLKGEEFSDLLASIDKAALKVTITSWTELADIGKEPGTYLSIFDLASDAEVTTISADAAMPPVARDKGRLYRLLSNLIRGSANRFFLKAVDSRTGLTIEEQTVTAPGVAEIEIKTLPACFTKEGAQ